MQRLLVIAVLFLQGGVALLGSGGLHALPGHRCDHVHTPGSRHVGHEHQHHGCRHHHHSPPASAPAEPRPFEPAPVDSGDCLICHLFLLGGIVAPPVSLQDSAPVVRESAASLSPTAVESLPRGPVSARGPPRV